MKTTIDGDVIAISPIEQFTTKTGKQLSKCTLTIRHQEAGYKGAIETELWDLVAFGKKCESLPKVGQSVSVDISFKPRKYTGKDGRTFQSIDASIDKFGEMPPFYANQPQSYVPQPQAAPPVQPQQMNILQQAQTSLQNPQQPIQPVQAGAPGPASLDEELPF